MGVFTFVLLVLTGSCQGRIVYLCGNPNMTDVCLCLPVPHFRREKDDSSK